MLHFVGDRDQKKFTKNPRHFSMQNSQANSKKKSTKCFWRAVKVKIVKVAFQMVMVQNFQFSLGAGIEARVGILSQKRCRAKPSGKSWHFLREFVPKGSYSLPRF